jgi:multicomponent Na+:H+ antiporter subunit D
MLFGHAKNGQGFLKIGPGKHVVILSLGILCLSGGVFGEQLIAILFNATVSVDAANYFEKIVFFAVSVIIGFFAVKYYINKSSLFARIKQIDIGFRGMCALMGGFFAVLLAAGYMI